MAIKYSKRSSELPALFRFATFLTENDIPGGYRLKKLLHKAGLLDRVYEHPLSGGAILDFPLDLYEHYALSLDSLVDEQDRALVQAVCRSSEIAGVPATLIDCGADIGIISVSCAADAPAVNTIHAFEPNSAACDFLRTNLSRLPMETHVYCKGVSSFNGYGLLREAPHDPSPHARFVVKADANEPGAFPVVMIDGLKLYDMEHLILKIDVEGSEAEVIKGAKTTLDTAGIFTVIFEAHPEQAKRTGIDPQAILSMLNETRTCYSFVIDDPPLMIDSGKPYLEQVDNSKNHDVLCTSSPEIFQQLCRRE